MKKSTFSSKRKSLSSSLINITLLQRYKLHSLKEVHFGYSIYNAIDILNKKWVYVYIKLKSSDFSFSRVFNERFRNKICPQVLDSDEVQIYENNYCFEIHEKYGPSLTHMFNKIKEILSAREVLHLLLQLIKLVEKIDNLKLVSGELEPDNITFSINPLKNELYLVNSQILNKKGCQKIIHTKYASRGVHLGRKIAIKDDVESICYILIDIFTQGAFLKNKEMNECIMQKLSLKIESFAADIPEVFVNFYHYIINLNYNDQVNFFYWKNYISQILTPDIVGHPYAFLLAKSKSQTLEAHQSEVQASEIEDNQQTHDHNGAQKQQYINKISRQLPRNSKINLPQI